MVDALVQMERELALLRRAAGSTSARDLEPLLSAAALALPPAQQPSAIEYAAGELRLRGLSLAPGLSDATNTAPRFTASLRTDGDSLLVRPTSTP